MSCWWPFAPKSAESVPPKHKWPDCAPPDRTGLYWELNSNLNVNGVNYLKKETAPGRWQWVENEEANKAAREFERRRKELFLALWTRALTPEEEAEAISHGDSLNIESMVPYTEDAKRRELHDAWFQQRRLQQIAHLTASDLSASPEPLASSPK